MKRFLIVYQDEGERREELVETKDLDYAQAYAQRIADSFNCQVKLQQLGVIDDWDVRPEHKQTTSDRNWRA